MKSNFKKCLDVTLVYEGGFSNHPKDPGGATMQGITQKVYDEYRLRLGKEAKPVNEIFKVELQEIYDLQYWDRARCDDLPVGVDLAVFDYAVNSGVSRAVKDLQRVLGCKVDGVAGMGTVAAALAIAPADVISGLCAKRLAFLRSLRTWGTFGKGWGARVAAIKARGLAMCGAADTPTGDDARPFTAPAKAPERAQAKLKTAEGAGLTIGGAGATGQTLMSTAEQVQPHISENIFGRLALAVFVFLMVAGGLLVLYSYFKRMAER
jgi:lysozyme family protein